MASTAAHAGKTGKRRQLSDAENGVVGAVVGALEVLAMQPTVYWKAELQQQRFDIRRALSPAYAYRGVVISACSIAPITAVQFGVNGMLIRRFSGEGAPSDVAVMASGVAAGVVSALIQSPCQLIEISQQKHGGSMHSVALRIVQSHGALGLYRAYSMTAAREGIFCCAYIAAMPLLRRSILERWPDLPVSAATATSTVVAGAIGAFLTHPADTFKTRLQGDLFPVRPGDPLVHTCLRASLADMQRQRSGASVLSQCYNGFAPRLFRLIACTFIYDCLRGKLENVALALRP